MASPASDRSPALPRRPLLALWAASGFSTLTLELLWMRELTLWAGHTVTASTLVIIVFFASAALGNLWSARFISGKERPLLSYGRFEVLAAVAAVASFLLCRFLWSHLGWLPSGWSLRALGALLLVGPPSFCSGMAFPSLAETFIADPRERTASGAPFYGANLLGAALGVAAGGVLLPHALGLRGAFAVAAGVQLLAGALAWRLAAKGLATPATTPAATDSTRFGWVLLAASGALSLAVQALLILWVKQVLDGSLYAVSAVLGVFVGGLGLGALAAGALRRRHIATATLLRGFAGASAVLLLAVPFVGRWLSGQPIALTAITPAGLLLQALAWGAIFLLPLTFSLGGIFPLAWEMAGAAATEGRVLGRALAVNKLGAALGMAAGLFLLLPLAGLGRGTCLLAWAYAALALFATGSFRPRLVVLAVVALGPSLLPHAPPGVTPDVRVLATTTGAYGPVTVIEDPQTQSRQILLNSRQRLSGTQHALTSQLHQSWVPLLLCREPRRVLTIGMAAGISAAAALEFPIPELHAVELVPEVVAAAQTHFSAWNAPIFTDSRARVIRDDGRLYLAHATASYDAILCDLFFPTEEGTAHLYSRDFFELARTRLTPSGVFCVWLPCYQLRAATADLVVRTFLATFPHAIMVRASFDPLQPIVGLVGSAQPLPISQAHLATQLAAAPLSGRSPFALSPAHAQLLLIGDLHAAVPPFDPAPITTDEHPLFAFLGPQPFAAKERLHGATFLNWSGRRFPTAHFPSCDLGSDDPTAVLATIRAANQYLATAVAATVLPGDPRPEAQRLRQVTQSLERARALSTATPLPLEALGH